MIDDSLHIWFKNSSLLHESHLPSNHWTSKTLVISNLDIVVKLLCFCGIQLLYT